VRLAINGSDPLPALATPFFARDAERDAIVAALAKRRALVTLVGPAGIGKTRLALEAMRASRRNGEGAERYVGVRHGAYARGALEQLRTADAGTERVLIDDAESDLDAVREAVRALRERASDARVLLTSRFPLGVADENVVPVAPLEIPDERWSPWRITRTASVAFLLQRCAQHGYAVGADVTTARELARLAAALGGLPLALELAAAELRFFGLRDLLERVAGTASAAPSLALEAMVAGAVALLDPHERRIFDRLAAFEAPFTIAEAEAICAGRRVPVAAIAPAIVTLAIRSLIAAETREGVVRYRLLGATRAYALRHADDEELARVRHRGGRWYTEWMRARPGDGKTDPETDRLLDERLENVRIALDGWCADPKEALAAIAATRTYWPLRAHGAETIERIERLRAAAGPLDARLDYGVARTTALCAARLGDRDGVRCAVARAAALAEALGDERARIDALNPAIIAAYNAGDFLEARRLLEESIAHYAAHGPRTEWARATANMAVVECSLGEYEAAERRYAAIRDVPQDLHGTITYWRNRAWTAVARDALIEARSFADEARRAAARPGAGDFYVAEATIVDALVSARSGDVRRAASLLADVVTTTGALRHLSLFPGLLQCALLVAAGQRRAAVAARLAGAFAAALRRAGARDDATIRPFRIEAEDAARCELSERRWTEEFAVGEALSPESVGEQIAALAAAPPEPLPLDGLSPREREIAELVGAGKTNREISASLHIQLKTVENHLAATFAKLQITRRSQLASLVARCQRER